MSLLIAILATQEPRKWSEVSLSSLQSGHKGSDRSFMIVRCLLYPPIAITTAGTWNDMAIELTQEIDRRITMVTEDTKETTYLLQQRLSMALQKGNAVSFPNTFLY